MQLTLTILGCGTSMGVPVPTCECPVCTSPDPRNNRLRSSVHFQAGPVSILVDTGPDLRTQVLRAGIRDIHSVLFTHAHSDHINGIDDLRMFSFKSRGIEVHALPATEEQIRRSFPYIFLGAYEGGMPAMLNFHEVNGPFLTRGVPVTPVPILHGTLPIVGYRIGNLAYLTDCKTIPETSLPLLEDLDTLVIDCLRPGPDHPTHMILNETLAAIEYLKPRRAYFTHMTHDMDYTAAPRGLPYGVELAYDGLVIHGEY